MLSHPDFQRWDPQQQGLSSLNSTVQTGYQKGLLLFDFVFILANPLELMFVTVKQL